MTPAKPLPPTVAEVLAAYRQALEREGVPALRGLYLVGSLALDDFRPGLSDIDFVALCDAAPSEETCAALGRVHAAVTERGGPCLDGFYIAASTLRDPPSDFAIVPFSLEGRFRAGDLCREINPVTWRCLARRGLTVFGPPPADLAIADDPDRLRRYQIENLRGYWMAWLAECEAALNAKAAGEDCNAQALAWGVLGVSRIACALATDRVVSKREGGHHALAASDPRWHAVVRTALSAHVGAVTRVPVETVRDGLALMRDTIGRATGRPGARRGPSTGVEPGTTLGTPPGVRVEIRLEAARNAGFRGSRWWYLNDLTGLIAE